ncbi:MAG: galactose-1-phosphate uridylyltransferase [bacterium]|nr:galactose-1-phosphate uridylyltransferase [bacterium]
MPQLRQNIITGEWVVIAPERAKRPSDFIETHAEDPTRLDDSPFAVGSKAWQHRVKNADTKYTYTVQNFYPAFVVDAKMCETRSFYPEHSFYRAKPAVGDHEVVVIKDVDATLYSLSVTVLEDLLLAYQSRFITMAKNPGIEFIACIYNHGPKAGASIRQAHGQIFASPIVPNYIQLELDGSQRYYNNNGINVFEDLVTHEKREKVRVIVENDYFLVFTFYAARFPFETWIVPKQPGGHFANINKTVRHAAASALHQVLARLNHTLKGPSVNFWIHCLPTAIAESKFYRWHIEIAPRVSGYGGYELGSGVIIDIASPEKAAEYLKDET